MKKTPQNKQNTKSTAVRGVNIKTSDRTTNTSSWSVSVYVYWFIILFFIAATFYILGRSHTLTGAATPVTPTVTEENLLQGADYYNTGKTKMFSGDVNGAIDDLSAAIAADENMLDAYILRGEAYLQGGDYQNAMVDFNRAIELDPQTSIAYYDRALLNTRLEDYEAALADINSAMANYANRPNDVLQMRDLYAKRGQLNLWQKNWEGAVADYTNSLARPDGTVSPDVYAERAEAYTAMGEYGLAIADYTSAIRVISEQIQGIGTKESKEDQSMRAMHYFEKSAALNLSIGNITSAKSDLEAAYAIAASLNDAESTERLQGLIESLQ